MEDSSLDSGEPYHSDTGTDSLVADAKKIIEHARDVLEPMLDYAPSESGKRYVARQCAPSYCYEDRTPASIETADEKERRLLWEQVDAREDHRCAVSKAYHLHRKLDNQVPPDFDGNCMSLDVAHIIPLSGNSSDVSKKITLIGSDINTPKNAILMTNDCHILFGRFFLYFDASLHQFPHEPNKYWVKSTTDIHLPAMGKHSVVCTFSPHPTIDPPSAKLLAVHAALAKVLHASSVMKYFDKVISNMEGSTVLDSNGGSDIGLFLCSRLAIPAAV
ncbi:hypothetical protein NEOLEDRAFT_1148264 [Neolentinus lepideus HHB14362 ss-1]|uniref:HNH nuclease domain-containing protein n=1 Tax=Neolentinus lepideus HHB14362 ss-1 TaxID=1314782 RepID=A0A165SDP9_9AGAM|nr:hypothetical protein NEOLEDRAFT_1148264 [Neolentinus lepideus HHB14362 ss-1]